MKIKNIEKIYDNMQEDIITELGKDKEVEVLWKELLQLEDELQNNLGKPEKEIFDDYLTKEAEIIDTERKNAFCYGYNLSNKLIIDSLRE